MLGRSDTRLGPERGRKLCWVLPRRGPEEPRHTASSAQPAPTLFTCRNTRAHTLYRGGWPGQRSVPKHWGICDVREWQVGVRGRICQDC